MCSPAGVRLHAWPSLSAHTPHLLVWMSVYVISPCVFWYRNYCWRYRDMNYFMPRKHSTLRLVEETKMDRERVEKLLQFIISI